MLEGILAKSEADSYEVYLSGPDNFRYSVYPEYKATRKNTIRPRWEKDNKDYLIQAHNAIIARGEADDAIAMAQTEDTIICSIDKDMDQVPGWHYRWPIIRLGSVVSEEKKYFITPEEGYRNFCYQLLIGDSTDNIKGVVGIGRKKAKKLLDENPPEQWWDIIRECYGSEEEFDMNAQCVYLLRKEGDHYSSIRQGQGAQAPAVGEGSDSQTL